MILQLLSGTTNSSIEAISQNLDEQSLEPESLSSHQLDTANKVDDGASDAKHFRDKLAYERQLLAVDSP